MSELALKLVNENLALHKSGGDASYLELGNCGLTDDDFIEGRPLDLALRECKHLKTLVISDAWTDLSTFEHTFSENEAGSNLLTIVPKCVFAIEGLLTLHFTSFVEVGSLNFLLANGTLHTLENLDFGGCGINEIRGLEIFPRLKILNLDNNNINELQRLDSLDNLTHLSLAANNISQIQGLEKLRNLIELHLEMNNIFNIHGLDELLNLNVLSFYGSSISEIKGLEKLINLTDLTLGGSKIAEIKGLENLINLKNLHIGESKIVEINGFENLVNLTDLQLNNNQISEIKGLENLINLKELNLGRNQISEIKGLDNLINLKELNLELNQISEIKGLENLINLEGLQLRGNHISEIKGLGNLNCISRINLEHNSIYDISTISYLCEKGFDLVTVGLYGNWAISIFGNPIINPPGEIWRQGSKAVLEYFRLIEKEGRSEEIYEAKLTLVGEGGAGKTTLQLRLVDKEAEPPQQDKHTRGVVITDWDISKNKNKKEIVHIWDFGGQDMYYPVHRFFLTENCVYVLMGTSRSGAAHNFDYWIPNIYQFGGSSPILVAQTCHDGYHEANWQADLSGYIQNTEFNIIRTSKDFYYQLNLLKRNKGLTAISNDIKNQVRKLKDFGKPVPPSFIKLRNALLNETEKQPCMSFEKFEEFCTGVDSGFTNPDTLELFAGTMHEIGVLIWYRKNPVLKDWVILKPEWAMKAVYNLLDDDKIEKKNGHISPDDFTRLWKGGEYRHRHQPLKVMLQVFKIAFLKRNSNDEYIFPTKQLKIPASAKWSLSEDSLRVWIKFNFMPKGLINQISADLSSFIQNYDEVWNNGVILSDAQHKSQCLLTENSYERKINIIAKGPEGRSLILKVQDSLNEIISEYRGVKFEIEIPCRCPKCALSENPRSRYTYEELLSWYHEKPGKELHCNDSEKKYSLVSLLRDSGLKPVSSVEDRVTEAWDIIDRHTRSRSFKQNFNIEFNPIINATANVNNQMDLRQNNDFKELKILLEDLQKTIQENSLWQDAIVGVLSEISAIENAPDKKEQKKKWYSLKDGWEALKIVKDARGIIEAFPWVSEKLHKIPDLIHAIDASLK